MKLNAIFFLTIVVSLCHGKVVLKKGEHVTVTFEGDQLEIMLDNPLRQKGEFELCFRSTSNARSKSCSEGYASAYTFLSSRQITFNVNRQGQLFSPVGQVEMEYPIVYEADGSLKIMLADHPSTMLVYLPNAELPVVTTTTLAPTTSTDTSKAKTGIICVIVILILAVLIIGAVSLYCWCNRRRHQPIPITVPEEDARDIRQKREEPLRKVVIESSASRPKPMRSTPLPSATATTTKLPSTSTTRTSNEKPKVAAVPKPTPATLLMRQTKEPNCVSIIPASAYDQRSTVGPRSSQLRSSVKEVVSIDSSQNC